MKKKLKVFFTDFWVNFNIEDNPFLNDIKELYDIEITDNNPDFLFYSLFGYKHNYFKCTRILYSGEYEKPNFNECDYCLSFFPSSKDKKIFRYPHYYLYGDMTKLLQKPSIDDILKKKTKFCNFIFSNPDCKKRNVFFKKLSKYKKVDSAGRFMNNIGSFIGMDVNDKYNFMDAYKFTIAFENREADYYTSEKVYEAMRVNSIPIYWGNKYVNLDFNTESFLNYYDYNNDEELIQRIIEIDNNQDLYIDYLSCPFFVNNQLNQFVDKNNILKNYEYIFNTNITPVATKSRVFSSNYISRDFEKKFIKIKYFTKLNYQHIKRLSPARLRISLHKIINKQDF